MIKIDEEKINKLLENIEKYNIPSKWITQICNVKCITDITVVQYNILLMLIQHLQENLEERRKVEIL